MPDAAPRIATDCVLIDRYRLVRLIAQGGMAQVWEGHDPVLDRPVAVKILHPHLAADDAFLERFRREAVAAAKLAHPNVVATYDTGVDGGLAFIVMELVRGHTLRDELGRGPLTPGRSAYIAAEVADALEYAHQAGIVHRDVKPANILLCDDGRVKVADFGIAKAASVGRDLTQTGALLGTAKYLSPEQVDGQPQDRRSDVYALGVVLYEMLCGRPPFTAETEMAIALAHLRSEPMSPRRVRAGVPRPLEAVVLRAMAKSPVDRFQTAADFCIALRSVDLGDDDAVPMVTRDPTPPSGITPSFAQTERSWLVPVVAIVVVMIVLGAIGVVVARTPTGSSLLHGGGGGAASSSTSGGPAIAIASAKAFDPPPGDGVEHDGDLHNLFDGNPQTTWETQSYASARFGGLKDGVGFVLTLGTPTKLNHLKLTTPSRGWSGQVYVADGPKASLAEWGQPVDSKTGISGGVTFDLKGSTGAVVLVWITELGSSGSVAVGEATLT
ncbi:MAG: Serine/threonine protein kinase [Acidimicrobiales bacterium]|nr:Serine/threonine protein kinase [Acidimicrobiales bacterium]